MLRGLSFFCVVFASFLGYSLHAELVISDFSPGANPFEAGGMFTSIRQNSDGTQTVRKEANGLFSSVMSLPAPLDLTDGGQYHALALTAKRAPNQNVNGSILLGVDTVGNEHTGWAVFKYEDFSTNEFSTVIYPFGNFYPGTDILGNPEALEFTNIQFFSMYQGPDNDGLEFNFTFDRLSAVSILEPSTSMVILLGGIIILASMGKRRGVTSLLPIVAPYERRRTPQTAV